MRSRSRASWPHADRLPGTRPGPGLEQVAHSAHLVLGVRRPKHPILGMELAGIVEAVGRDVTLFGEG